MIRPITILLFLLPLAGCADKGSFPSLTPRPAEKLSMDEPVRQPPVIASDADLTRQITDLLASARRGQAGFEEHLPRASATAGSAGAAGSESWIEAQQALSRLEAARAPTGTALAELDALSVKRAILPTNANDFAALQAALNNVSALAEGQQEVVDRLRRGLGPG